MSFTGRDYADAFRMAGETVAASQDREVIDSELTSLEWILWEAIRGGLAVGSIMISTLSVLPLAVAFDALETWRGVLVAAGAVLVAATFVYGMMRLALWYEVTRHIKGRRFGAPFPD